MYKFQKYSRFYKQLFKLIFLGIIIFVPLFWAIVQTNIDIFSSMGISQQYLEPYVEHPLSLSTRVLALLASLIPTCVILYIVSQLIKLFNFYENLEVFSINTVLVYKRLGIAIILWSLAEFIYTPIISLILSFGNSAGHRLIAVNISGLNIYTIILGGIVIIIASVMRRAQEISEENDLTI